MRRAKKLATAAMLTALATVLVYLAALAPRGGLALVAAAGLLPAAVIIECGVVWGTLHYVAVCILSFLLAPNKMLVLWYIFVLGHYGIFKALIERLRWLWLQWICKLAVFFAATGLLYGLFSSAFAAAMPAYGAGILAAGLLVCFVLYDLAFSGLIGFYRKRIHRAVQ